VATASNPYIARDKILQLRPDVLTLDVEMPEMDGLTFLRKLMPQYPVPVVMVSSLTESGARTTLNALQAGAVDFVAKPSTDIARSLSSMIIELRRKVKMAANVDVSRWKRKKELVSNIPRGKRSVLSHRIYSNSDGPVIVIGASTGGTEAIKEVVSGLSANFPGVVIVQHMPAGFTAMFAERLDQLCDMKVSEARNGDEVVPGRILLAPGGYHMSLARFERRIVVKVEKGPLVNGHCPSVGVLMESASGICGANAVGIMLTGMGSDGAEGMRLMKDAGAFTLAQDERSCVVFGMPKAAWSKGGVDRLVPLNEMAFELSRILREKFK
jgi:two-component system chemotaxis response regulator CheB